MCLLDVSHNMIEFIPVDACCGALWTNNNEHDSNMKCWESKQKTRKRDFGDFKKLQKWWEIMINNGRREQPIKRPN
jgi:hypothetical protein